MKRPDSPSSSSRASSSAKPARKPTSASTKSSKLSTKAKAPAAATAATERSTGTRGFDRAALSAAIAEQRRKATWLGGFQFSAFSVVLALVLLLGIVSLVPRIQPLAAQQAEINALKSELAQTRAEIEAMREERVQWSDSTFLASEARERLFYVMPGDVSYLVINDLPPEALTLPQSQVSAELKRTDTDWIRSLFGSFWVASHSALEPSTPAQPAPTDPVKAP